MLVDYSTGDQKSCTLTLQGFASGSLDADAGSVRMFVADGGECLAAQSYAKNMGLYGERVGALSIVRHSASESFVICLTIMN